MDLQFEEVVEAYFKCRKNKRSSLFALDFEFELEKNLFDLFQDLKDESYEIGPSLAFVVEQPVIREIWAATFRDRVVHHLIYNRLHPRFYPSFIRNSFACIPGRGTLDGSDRLLAGMRSLSQNWQKPGYFLKADVRNYFVSIDKLTLFDLLRVKIREPWLLNLVRQIIFHDPRETCYRKSSAEAFARVPRYKSLWHTYLNKGLPIGNLTSQFFANVYLNELDQFVKHKLKAKRYYRYVDDFIILHDRPGQLMAYYDLISVFLKDRLNLEIHPFKKQIGFIDQGVDFVGFFHKPYRRYPRKRTSERVKSLVRNWKKNPNCFDCDVLLRFRNSTNSYFGLLRQLTSYRFRKHLGDQITSLFIYPDENYQKLILPPLKK